MTSADIPCAFIPADPKHPLRSLYGLRGKTLRIEAFLLLLASLPYAVSTRQVEDALREGDAFPPSLAKTARQRLHALVRKGWAEHSRPLRTALFSLTDEGRLQAARVLESAEAILQSSRDIRPVTPRIVFREPA